MLDSLRVWLIKPLAEALDALEQAQCAQTKRHDALEQAWKEAETNLDSTYRRVHSELGYIDKRSADLRKLEASNDEAANAEPRVGPFSGGRNANVSRRTR